MKRVWHTPQAYLRDLLPLVAFFALLGGGSLIDADSSCSIAATASASSLSKLISGEKSVSLPKISLRISVGVRFAWFLVGGAPSLEVEATGAATHWAALGGCRMEGIGGVDPCVYSVGIDRTLHLSGASAVTGVHGESILLIGEPMLPTGEPSATSAVPLQWACGSSAESLVAVGGHSGAQLLGPGLTADIWNGKHKKDRVVVLAGCY